MTAADLDLDLDTGLAPVLATPGSTNAGSISVPSFPLANQGTPASSEPGPATTGRPRIDPLEALRARGERAQVRTAAVAGEGFRFIKPNLALAQILGAMVAELGSEEAMFERVRQGLQSQTGLSPEELAGPLDEYRRFYAQSRESLEPETTPMTV